MTRRASIVLLASGIAIGTILDVRSAKDASRPPMADAMAAYRVFAGHAENAVEIDAARTDTLTHRISDHLGRGLAIPNLSKVGLSFLGCRLLASDKEPGSMLIYSEPNGERVAVYVKTLADGRHGSFDSRRDGDVVAYYWFDGRLGYAVTGKAGSPVVSAAATRAPGSRQVVTT